MKSIIFIFYLSFTCTFAQIPMQTRTQALMGTFVHITLPLQHNVQISQSFQLIKEIEHSLSSYDPNALVYILNHKHKVAHDTHLLQAILDSKQYYKDTYGYFDISIGSISKKLYHFGEEKTFIPSKKALQEATLSMAAVELNTSYISTDENITLDLGGMGKGYAVDVVVDFLKEQNISQGIVALSGDIRCLDLCNFELQSPYSEQTFIQLRSLNPQLSISTSGTYRRYVGSKEKHHLINPKTATQEKAFVSVSLFTYASNAKIDAYATAVSVMPKEKALAFLKEHTELGFILVKHDGKIIYGNLEKFVSFVWLDYKEKVNMAMMPKNTSTKSDSESNFIHPDTTSPKEINK